MATRYPILLVHGIALKDFLFFKAFGRIERILTEAGYKVYTSRIDGFGTTETNAAQLRTEVMQLMEETHSEKINIIAHSKGGLDSRRMITDLGMEGSIASLTTLCTPHMGSPVASGILKLPHWMLTLISFWLNVVYRIFGDKQPNSYEVCRELALIKPAEENRLTLHISDKIYCQSFSTTLERSRDDFVMGIPLMFSHYWKHKPSDGLVSADSSRFGTYRGTCVDASVSHTEIVDFLAKKRKREKIFAFYTTLCRELEEKGF